MDPEFDRLERALAPRIALERRLGSGGMGTVWLGREVGVDRLVAIKTLRPDRYTAAAAQRFIEEARNAARLFHPNIVRVHYNSPDSAADPYFVMQYMEGETLRARLDRGVLPYERVVSLGHDLLAALGVAHRAGIIHRDVKPGNVFLENGRAILGDFGISLAIDRTTDREDTAGPLGTPDYMAPEQYRGDASNRSDLYAVGVVLWEACTGRRWEGADPAAAEWSQVPAPLREPIARALQWDQADRWPDAAAFAGALPALQEPDTTQPTAGRRGTPAPARRPARRTMIVWATVAAAAIVGAAWLLKHFRPPPTFVRQVGLVVAPFDPGAGLPVARGYELAGRTTFYLYRLPRIGGPPIDAAARAWRSSDLPESERLPWLASTMQVRYGVWGSVQLRGAALDVRLRGYDTLTRRLVDFSVRGDSADLADLGDRIGLEITERLVQDSVHLTATPLFTRSAGAAADFWQGEEASSRGAWKTAEEHYLRALQADSAFVPAKWRLGMARRWSNRPETFPPGFYPLDSIGRQSLTPTEAMLVDAQFARSPAQRFELYRQAVDSAPGDPWAALLYGDELFHRGPLVGRPLDSAVAMLGRAAADDPYLAPAWEHLAWAQIRLGHRDAASAALARLLQTSGPSSESWIYLPDLMRAAFALRFEAPSPADAVAAFGSIESLALAARGAIGFDMPRYQLAFGERLTADARAGSPQRANGLVAQGVALIALGRPAAAFTRFDSAASLFPSPDEALLQAAEWRVLPAALGLPGVSAQDRADGRARLAARAVGTDLRAVRAAWALAVDGFLRGDTAMGSRWRAQVTGRGDAATEPLDRLLAALEARARGDPGALALTDPVLDADSAGRQPDPFLRATLHLVRGDWADAAGDATLADRAWLWSENTDAVRWPSAEAQPVDVDWALGAYAGAQRASLAFRRGDRARGCLLARRTLEFWREPEPGMAEAVKRLLAQTRGCLP
jgi:serine/threonine protein kinase/tetratricopeptide (TPR) repeat protein